MIADGAERTPRDQIARMLGLTVPPSLLTRATGDRMRARSWHIDHLVGANQKRVWIGQAERIGGL
jgi:hypothetical protein